MRSWIVSVGPNPGRGSSHAHGPVTNTGPVRVVEAARMDETLICILSLVQANVEAETLRKAIVAELRELRGPKGKVPCHG